MVVSHLGESDFQGSVTNSRRSLIVANTLQAAETREDTIPGMPRRPFCGVVEERSVRAHNYLYLVLFRAWRIRWLEMYLPETRYLYLPFDGFKQKVASTFSLGSIQRIPKTKREWSWEDTSV
jgi:hypothetical protein